MEKQSIVIPPIKLEWSQWEKWSDIILDARGGAGVFIPNFKPGVYEVRLQYEERRLTIGKASNLRFRVRQGLVKGKSPHSSGKDIREKEDISKIVVRWAETDRPAAVEEHLHMAYLKRFGEPPKYTDHT
jgi:hypothetical protein